MEGCTILAAYVAAHKPKQLTQPLFYTQRSIGFTANTLTHIVNGIYKNTGISGATSHSGRRTGLTNLAERGVGVRVLMALAGHSNMGLLHNVTLTCVLLCLKRLLSWFS